MSVILVHRCLLMVENGRQAIFLQRSAESRNHPNLWEGPGGKVGDAEDFREALYREVREELNLEIRVQNNLTSTFSYMFQDGKLTHRYLSVYSVARQVGGILTLSDEHQHVRIMPLNIAVHSLALTPPTRQAIRALSFAV